MDIPDAGVLVYAHRQELKLHDRCRSWLTETASADAAFGLSEATLAEFVRLVTSASVFIDPSPIDSALRFTDEVRSLPNAVVIRPGERHWPIFSRMCTARPPLQGGEVRDAFHAATAIEHGGRWITTDRRFRRFDGLRVQLLTA